MSCSAQTADLRPAQYNVNIWRNDTWNQVFEIKVNSEPVDLTGSSIAIQVRKKANSTTIDLTLSTEDGSIAIVGENNNQIILNKQVTIASGSYLYDMSVSFPSGEVKTYIWGNFMVQEDITKI